MTTSLSTLRIAGFPSRYLQGPGALNALESVAGELDARHLLIVSDDIVDLAIGQSLQSRLSAAGMQVSRLRFGGECTAAAILALTGQAHALNGDAVVGLGGGKAIDTAKGVAKALDVALIIAPTIASNDSPTSRLIVLYDDAHRVAGVDYLKRNPDVVLVDTAEIVKAPVRFFRAGIGDALSKKFEAVQCMQAQGLNFYGGRPPETARILAEQSYELIRRHGAAAVNAVACQTYDPVVETVVEATVLLSGLGFESGGLSIAHAMVRGLSGIPALGGAMHGEMVTFGTVVQLLLESRPPEEIAQHLQLLSSMGLSATFAGLGKATLEAAELDVIATLTLGAPYIRNFSRVLSAADLIAAARTADYLGQRPHGGGP